MWALGVFILRGRYDAAPADGFKELGYVLDLFLLTAVGGLIGIVAGLLFGFMQERRRGVGRRTRQKIAIVAAAMIVTVLGLVVAVVPAAILGPWEAAGLPAVIAGLVCVGWGTRVGVRSTIDAPRSALE
jgi:4-amino-4-deoxy-L-arabinose transferase-like glycosyltransferase